MSSSDLWNQPLPAAVAKGNFFAVDARAWAKVCESGAMNELVAYLVQARGTARDNRTSTWSVEAIERYTGISRHKAAASVKNLRAKGFEQLLRSGTKPKYDLIPFSELPGADPRPALSGSEQNVLHRVQDGLALGRNHREHARTAAKKGWLLELEGEFAIAPVPEIKPDLIWLPNELVTGAVGEIPPLELVRQTQDPLTLRLLVDMYHSQNLREDGGISRQIVWKEFERFRVGERAQFTVWGFRYNSAYMRWRGFTKAHWCSPTAEQKANGTENNADSYFRREGQLADLGLIEWVPHLFESEEESGEVIHPLGLGASERIEDRLRLTAHEAAESLLTAGQYQWAVNQNVHLLVPVPRHIAKVQLISIARLRYRPQTRMTSAWWADLTANAEKHLARYAQIARQATRAAG
jgi:biotin operon repressor